MTIGAEALPFPAVKPSTPRLTPWWSGGAVPAPWPLRLRREAVERGLRAAFAQHVLHEPERHADPGAGEPEVPVDALREVARR